MTTSPINHLLQTANQLSLHEKEDSMSMIVSQPLTTNAIMESLNHHAKTLQQLGARRLGLFGSYRHGTATPQSDIDILVTLNQPTFDSYMEIKLFLEDLFERKVDLVLEHALKPRLRPIILNEVMYVEGI